MTQKEKGHKEAKPGTSSLDERWVMKDAEEFPLNPSPFAEQASSTKARQLRKPISTLP